MKRISLLLFILTAVFTISAQDSLSVKKKKINIAIHGFIKTDYWYDTRQVAYAREGLFTLFPKDINADKNGNDINGEPSFNYSAITSRLNFLITGPDAFGAKTSAFIEADFSGMSNVTINTFRLRHAYLEMKWKKADLLLGQFWHPNFVTEVFPTVISLNTGAPFQPFIRNPQIRFTRHFGNYRLIATALAQRDYSNSGPLGRDFSYLSNSLTPNLNLRFSYDKGKHHFGISADWKTIRPSLTNDSNVISKNSVTGFSYMAYYGLKTKTFDWKTKAILGENLTEHLLLGGYAVASFDTITGSRTYTPTRHIFLWTNFVFHKAFDKFSIHPALFLGYAQNLGTVAENTGVYYATGADIGSMYRISPSFSIKSGSIMFSLEWEFTQALYGKADSKGIIKDTHAVANNRILFTGFYFF